MSATFNEFTKATGDAIASYELWAGDPHGTAAIPEDLRLSIELASLIGSQCDVAPRGRSLAIVAVPAWSEAVSQYISGAMDRRGNRVSVADTNQGYRDVKHALELYSAPPVSIRSSVAQLRLEGAAHRQIAAIYSSAGDGPFYGEGGIVITELIDQEADMPGSVVKPGWEDELIESQNERKIEDIRSRIADCGGKPLHAEETEQQPEQKRRGRPPNKAVAS